MEFILKGVDRRNEATRMTPKQAAEGLEELIRAGFTPAIPAKEDLAGLMLADAFCAGEGAEVGGLAAPADTLRTYHSERAELYYEAVDMLKRIRNGRHTVPDGKIDELLSKIDVMEAK